MEMGANPKLLEKESSTFQVSEHLRKLLYHTVWTVWITVRNLLCVETLRTALAFICLDDSAARPDDFQCSIKLQDFFRKNRYGKIAAIVRTTWIPV